jgi:hypothetical protein
MRDRMAKRILAREWLYFLGGLIVGFVLVPFLLAVLLPEPGVGLFRDAMGLYKRLFNKREWGDWLFVLAPYLLFQLIRSIVWATKAVRS